LIYAFSDSHSLCWEHNKVVKQGLVVLHKVMMWKTCNLPSMFTFMFDSNGWCMF